MFCLNELGVMGNFKSMRFRKSKSTSKCDRHHWTTLHLNKGCFCPKRSVTSILT